MPTYKVRQAVNVFAKLAIKESSSDHHRRGFLMDDTTGMRLFPPIYFNKGNGDLYPKIARKMRDAFRLDQQEFHQLMSCFMKREEYFSIRRRRDEGGK